VRYSEALAVFRFFYTLDMRRGEWSQTTQDLASLVQTLAAQAPPPEEVRAVIRQCGYKELGR
jgi:hypothetical protein